jgi:hypothetical protein
MPPKSKAAILGIVRVVPDLRQCRFRSGSHGFCEPAFLLAVAQEAQIVDLREAVRRQAAALVDRLLFAGLLRRA